MSEAIDYINRLAKATRPRAIESARRAAILAVDRLNSAIEQYKVVIKAERISHENKLHAATLDIRSNFDDASKWRFMEPIPIRLFCPACGEIHIDEGEFSTKKHHTHACQKCGNVWRPAVWNTVGVRFLPGFKNGDTP